MPEPGTKLKAAVIVPQKVLPPGPFAALSHRNFRVYWAGQAVSLTGVWMQQMALSWVIVGLTGSTASIAMVNFVWSLPMIAFTLYGGAVADRYDRRRTLIVTQFALALLAFAYVALIAGGVLVIAHVYVLAVLLGTVMAFDLPSQQSLVPRLVPDHLIPHAIALNQALFHGARLVGPAMAGFLIAATSVSTAFAINGISYFAVIVSLLIIVPRKREGPRASMSLAALKEGFDYVRQHDDIKAMMAFTAFTSTLVFPFLIVFMAIAVKTMFHGGEGGFGIIMSASGLGAMLGSLSVTLVPPGRRGVTIIVLALGSASTLAAIVMQNAVWPVALLIAVMTFCVALSMGLGTTIVQIKVPDQFRGRVMSLHTLTFTSLMPSAALALGALGDHIGLRPTVLLMAGAYALTAVPWLLRARVWRFAAGK